MEKAQLTADAVAGPERDGDRIRRLMARFVGGGYVAYFVLAAQEFQSCAQIVAPWWTPAAVCAAFLPGWALLLVSFRRRVLATVVVPLACAAGYLAAVASWFVAWTGEHTDRDMGTWLVTFSGLAALALVVCPRPWISLPYLAVATSAVQVANAVARSAQFGPITAPDVGWAVAFSAVYVLAAIGAVKAGELLDTSKEWGRLLAAHTAAQRKQAEVRALYDRLVHDDVLFLLHRADLAGHDPRMAEKARTLIRDWERSPAEPDPAAVADAEGVLTLLHSAIADVNPTAQLEIRSPGMPSETAARVPLTSAVAIAGAAKECARNVVRHAGSHAQVIVTARLASLPVTVTIVDDGPGFDLASVRAEAMGISRSIVSRMHDAGGVAHIVSAPGSGTTVELVWPR